ncbi:toll/interleukin-1 receptor domain-containing protein [Micropruina sp.]|uniref:toll/interleukin-1 receptor domain-containing protein n=1 Tax=Micropruina sp. TaxID=2737536 RepID=UPI0039E71E29
MGATSAKGIGRWRAAASPISYRRGETAWPARQLYEVLVARFGAGSVFKDVDAIEPGEDFVERITEAVAGCDVLLALIGPHWLTMTDATGARRLDDPDDFVRLELAAALTRGCGWCRSWWTTPRCPGPTSCRPTWRRSPDARRWRSIRSASTPSGC